MIRFWLEMLMTGVAGVLALAVARGWLVSRAVVRDALRQVDELEAEVRRLQGELLRSARANAAMARGLFKPATSTEHQRSSIQDAPTTEEWVHNVRRP